MQKFDTTAPVTAVVDVPAGRISFIAADRAETTVEVRPADASKGRDVKAAEETRVVLEGGVLRVDVPEQKKILGPTGVVEVTVQLPAGSRVDGKVAAGELRGVGRLGDVRFEGAQAVVKLDEAASVRLELQLGDVSIGRLTGDAEIGTQKGDLQISEAVRGTVVLRTEHGGISIVAARGTSATLDAGTSYGRVHNSLTNAAGPEAELNIRATTSYGDITARSL
ncbi:DUF4097 family beta strand repeat-containing protein [Streptomyces sp. NRRL WC-3742]|uniref:DUF4097 family beta strand repeat-containing protein n=1 Tax=Streptomyces sp. NRRL WC-3742 TaxID=1463934 RepID=UPI0004CBCF34|nr:DUF4097 family beta strand repeat-containing protein [Streptomyces sp. NRRL WC-3742]